MRELELQSHRSPKHRPVRRGTTNKVVGVSEEEFPTWEGPVTDNGYMKPAPLPSIGGAEGAGGSYHGFRVREAGPPVRCYHDAFIHTDLTLGTLYTMSRPTMTRPRAEQREGAARDDLVDLRRRRTSGATVRCQRGGFLGVSPIA